MKKLHVTALALMLVAGTLTSCSYTAEDYVDDMKALTEETYENASSYTAEDWKRVGEEFVEINKKGMGVLKDLSKEQIKELKKMKKELSKKAPELDTSSFEENMDDMMDKANDAMKDLMDKLGE